LSQPLEKRIEEEYNYLENVLRLVECTVDEQGLAIRGTVEKFLRGIIWDA